MKQMTRRAMMRSGAGASIAALSAASIRAEADGGVFHVFVFQWKANATEADKARAAKDIAAFQGAIPGLLETHVGPNLSPRGKSYTFGGVMRFKDQAALDAYVQHPAHQALLKWLVPLIDAIELDINA